MMRTRSPRGAVISDRGGNFESAPGETVVFSPSAAKVARAVDAATWAPQLRGGQFEGPDDPYANEPNSTG